MADSQWRVGNHADDTQGSVVQAGAIHHVWLGETTAHGTSVTEGRSVVPRQLPPVVRDFTGRTEHLAALDALLPTERDGNVPSPCTAVITAIDGAAGIGKTTLAVWWAHRVQHEFPDGTLYANLRGYGPGDPATPAEVLDGFLRALGVPPERMPVGAEAQAGLFRSLLAERRILIVLDNAHDPDQVRPLLPGTPGCMAVATSRDSLTGLVVTDGASRLTLDLLTEHEAVQLVTGVIGPDRADAETAAVAELVRWCARLPLALRIAAGRAAVYPHSTVADVVTELADERARLDVLSRGGDERAAVRAVFDWSYQRLSPEQAQAFRRLGLHPGHDLSDHAATAVAGSAPQAARQMLDELAQTHLIEPVSQGRYRFHDLLRAYALEQALRYDTPADRIHAQQRLLDWYADTARTCDTLLYPAHDRLPPLPTGPAYPTPIADKTRALAWLTAERDNLIAAVHHAARHGLHQYTLCLADQLRFLYGFGSWEASLEAAHYGIAAAQHIGDRHAESWFLIRHGEAFVLLRKWGEAQADFDQALVLASDVDDPVLHAGALLDLGFLSVEQGRFEQALAFLDEALPMAHEVGTARQEAAVECNLSRAYAGLGQYQDALRHAHNELGLHRRRGDLDGEVAALHDLACAWQGLGEHHKTIDLCREAISLGRTLTFLASAVAKPLDTLAVSLHHTGEIANAIDCWQEAATIFDDYGRPFDADRARDRARRASAQT